MYKSFLANILSLSLVLGPLSYGTVDASAQAAPAKPAAPTPDQQAMDKLLAPIALYPDALLAQVLASAGSPQQITEVNKWIAQNSQLQGSELQAAAEKAGFDASFIALVLFPDVLKLLGENLPWTTELGKAFTSDQKAVLASVQRLRAQAQAMGNLKTTPQQEVKTETQNGQTVIVVQPANPQIVYVPVYNTQTVYTTPPPPPPKEDNSDEVAAAAIIGFGLGIVLGAAMSNDSYGYYGYSSWGMSWHSSVVVVRGGAWRVPPGGRYGYARPVPHYRANTNINAPRNTNVNVNIDNVNNVNRQPGNTNTGNNGNRQPGNTTTGRTPRPSTTPAAPSTMPSTGRTQPSVSDNPRNAGGTSATRPATAGTQPSAPSNMNSASGRPTQSSSGASRPAAASTASPARQMETGARTSAFSGYQSGSGERAASSRGRSSSARSGSRRR